MLQKAMALQDTLVAHRRILHQNAEIRFDLPFTRAYVLAQLKQMGYAAEEVGGGIIALAGSSRAGKTFLLRADMDALPILEESDVPFRSTTGNMHACGHDFHTAMLLGAAQLIKQHETTLRGNIKLMFQPAEENMSGAKRMIGEGALQNPRVDAAMMIHVMPGFPLDAGTVIFAGKGPSYAACDWFDIQVKGKGGHGAMPDSTVDPLSVIAHIHIALQEIIAREISPQIPVVLTVGEMNGGTAPNIIPETAYLRGTLRTYDEKARAFAKARIEQIAKGIAETFRARAEVGFSMACPAVATNEALDATLSGYARDILGEQRVMNRASIAQIAAGSILSGMGSEDFAYIAGEVPGACVVLAAGSPAQGHTRPLHHPQVTFDESALAYGAALYAGCAVRWLESNG